MITSSEIPSFDAIGFDGPKYIRLQTQAIEDRMSHFSGRLYLEIGGKFLYDPHAARVLPWFDPASKKEIFSSFAEVAEVLFCINAEDIVANRQLSSEDINYVDYVMDMIVAIEKETTMRPHIVLNMLDPYSTPDEVVEFQRMLQRQQYRVWERYAIDWYPDDVEHILSEDGFGQDDHIPLTKNLILVTGAASSSGKMSTCMWQIYQDSLIEIKSGYAKYETFPIWNLSVDHPVNLAYEAATADIGDYNCLDEYHMDAYGIEAVNYNRDVEAFTIVSSLSEDILNHKNYMRKYKSPTDMGISTAGSAISDDEIVCRASIEEIQRRKERYQQMVDRGDGQADWVEKCEALAKRAKEYCANKWYKI